MCTVSAQRRSAAAMGRRKEKPATKADPAVVKKLTFKEQKELDGLFERIEAAEGEAEAIAAQLADPATYKRGDVDVSQLGDRLEAARELAVELTARWEELEARKDATTR